VSEDNDETLIIGEYLLAMAGYAMIRHCLTDPSAARPRVDEMRQILAGSDTIPYSVAIPLTEHAASRTSPTARIT
jgi:hypothetical protein